MGTLQIFSIPVSLSFIFIAFSFLCLVLIEAQTIVNFPTGTTITSSTPTVIANEQIYTLQMSGAQPTRVSQRFIVHIICSAVHQGIVKSGKKKKK